MLSLLGVSGEKPCEGREPLRADKAASSQNQHQGRATSTENKADSREKVCAIYTDLLQTMLDPSSTNNQPDQ